MANETVPQENMWLSFKLNIPYRYSAGAFVGRFLRELRDNAKIYGNKCPKCGRYLVPPRILCGRCHVRMGDFVEMSDRGTVIGYNVAEQSFWDPTTGEMRQVPYTAAVIQLDGAPASMIHFLEETNHDKLRLGMKVQAVFKSREQRTGNILDIKHFKTIEN